MSKLSVKYLDAETGNYEYATVIDVGDLDKLKTTVKSDLVSAINSIGITGNVPEGIQSQLDYFNIQISDLKNAELTEKQLAEINFNISESVKKIMSDVEELNNQITAELNKSKQDLIDNMESKFADAEVEYNTKVKVINETLDVAKQDIDFVEQDLTELGDRLLTAETNYVNVTQKVDTINGELLNKVNASDFDLMESKINENSTEIKQTKSDISLLATKQSLDLATDRIAQAESNIELNASGLSSRVTYSELNKELEEVSKYGDNKLRGTRDWVGWNTDNISSSYISNDTYRHCKIQVITDKVYYHYIDVEDLEIGKTYTASVYFKTNEQSDYAKVVFLEDETENILDEVQEDTTIINGWKRVYVNFTPSKSSFKASFKFSLLDTNNIGYFVAPKIEVGLKPSEWKAHNDDDSEAIIKNESLISQQSDSISTLVSSTKKMGEDITVLGTQITQTKDSITIQAEKIEEIKGEVSNNKASIDLATDEISLKVSQLDVDKSISNITLDTKNRIVNSNFIYGFKNWNERNSGFVIKTIDDIKYASITRTGLSAVSIASMASDKFPIRNKDNLIISADVIIDDLNNLDDKNIMSIELFNIEDVRVFSKTFNISELYPNAISNVKFRGYSKFKVDREDVSKARLKIQLNKNGSINFSNISVQKGDLNEADWIAAPEDEQLYRVETQTSIDQNAQNILLKANQTDLDASNRKLNENTASIEIANDNISQVVTNYEAMSNRVTQAESSITQNADSITQKVSSIDVENILTGKSYATQSQLTQTSSSLTSTISSVKSDAETALQQSQNAHAKSVKSSTVTYQAWESGTSVPTGVWATSIPTVSASQYLWTRTVFILQDDTATTSYSVSKMGENGVDGSDGVSPINLVIESSNGYQFKNNIINTTFTAILYQDNKEIDIDGTKFAYVWSKTNSDGTVDTAWNLAHRTSQKSITITNSDVRQRATFDCTAESLN